MSANLWRFLSVGIVAILGWKFLRGQPIDSPQIIMMIMSCTFAEIFGQIEDLRKGKA